MKKKLRRILALFLICAVAGTSGFVSDAKTKYYNEKVVEASYYDQGGYTVAVRNASRTNHNLGMKSVYVIKYLKKHGYIKVNARSSMMSQYLASTASAVKRFQRRHGLKATGRVNYATWKKMGYTKKQWYSVGSYVTPLKVDEDATTKERIQAMIDTAKEYVEAGTKYAGGCSGKPGQYTDCSGLLLQCLYSAGVDPKSVSVISHSTSRRAVGSSFLAADKRLGKVVSASKRKKGDLVFYVHRGRAKKDSNVCHIALYAGNGMIYDNWPWIGATYRKANFNPGSYTIYKYVRVFF